MEFWECLAHVEEAVWQRCVAPAQQAQRHRVAKQNVCLVNALRSLGLPVPLSGPGPFRALTDGNAMLRPLGLGLRHADVRVAGRGRFVLWFKDHFVGVRFAEAVTVFDGSRRPL
jgi:hypothetical protein